MVARMGRVGQRGRACGTPTIGVVLLGRVRHVKSAARATIRDDAVVPRPRASSDRSHDTGMGTTRIAVGCPLQRC
jgi:hypothetical protein